MQWAQHLLNDAVLPARIVNVVLPGPDADTSSWRSVRAANHPGLSLLDLALSSRNELLAANAIAFISLAHRPDSLAGNELDYFAKSLLTLLREPTYVNAIRADIGNTLGASSDKARYVPLFNTASDAISAMLSSALVLVRGTEQRYAGAGLNLRQLLAKLGELRNYFEDTRRLYTMDDQHSIV